MGRIVPNKDGTAGTEGPFGLGRIPQRARTKDRVFKQCISKSKRADSRESDSPCPIEFEGKNRGPTGVGARFSRQNFS